MAVDFSYAAMMQGQAQSLQQAIDLLSGGGRITIMHCATAAGAMPGIEVMVNTADVVLPPEIITAITDAMAVQRAGRGTASSGRRRRTTAHQSAAC
jgi:hypothetical protein